jgi:hypothetical protein
MTGRAVPANADTPDVARAARISVIVEAAGIIRGVGVAIRLRWRFRKRRAVSS